MAVNKLETGSSRAAKWPEFGFHCRAYSAPTATKTAATKTEDKRRRSSERDVTSPFGKRLDRQSSDAKLLRPAELVASCVRSLPIYLSPSFAKTLPLEQSTHECMPICITLRRASLTFLIPLDSLLDDAPVTGSVTTLRVFQLSFLGTERTARNTNVYT